MMTASGTSEREVAAMACGDPIDPMDSDSQCSGVLRDVWLFLDDEMDPENRARVQQHLDECSPCLVEAGLDQKLKQLLHKKCGGDRAPEQLRSRLIASLQTVQVSSVADQGVDQLTVQTLKVDRSTS
jgi:mycothiol system anti-sigma-R factor